MPKPMTATEILIRQREFERRVRLAEKELTAEIDRALAPLLDKLTAIMKKQG